MAIWEASINIESEEKKKADLALLIPHQTLVSMEWAVAFRHLRLPSYLQFYNRGMPIDVAREQMVRSALKHDIKYIFFLDSDVVLNNPNAVMDLISLMEKFNLPILSALYWAKKRDIISPAAWKIVERKGNEIKFAPVAIEQYIKENKIIEVDAIGMGAVIIKREVFDKLEEKNPEKPFFIWGLGRKNVPQISEDFYFTLRCIDELNIHPYVATMIRAYHVAYAHQNKDNGKLELMPI